MICKNTQVSWKHTSSPRLATLDHSITKQQCSRSRASRGHWIRDRHLFHAFRSSSWTCKLMFSGTAFGGRTQCLMSVHTVRHYTLPHPRILQDKSHRAATRCYSTLAFVLSASCRCFLVGSRFQVCVEIGIFTKIFRGRGPPPSSHWAMQTCFGDQPNVTTGASDYPCCSLADIGKDIGDRGVLGRQAPRSKQSRVR